MTLWAKFKDLAERVGADEGPATTLHEEELRLAAAALLVHASAIDGHVDAVERRKLKELLRARFNLDSDELRKLLGEADQREMESVDLYQFTSVLCRRRDASGSSRCCGRWCSPMASCMNSRATSSGGRRSCLEFRPGTA